MHACPILRQHEILHAELSLVNFDLANVPAVPLVTILQT